MTSASPSLRFSANLGFLWKDIPLPDAIRAAKRAGFAAVECHWPYDTPPGEVRKALAETEMEMLGINTSKGGDGDFGLSACPDRQAEARVALDQAIDYAEAIDAKAIHVMAGIAEGSAAHETFLENLRYAASRTRRTLLIEPINHFDAPGYFLNMTDQAAEILRALDMRNIKLMFDCYHVARTEGDVGARLRNLKPLIGHIQIASVPDRQAPDHGGLDYAEVFATLQEIGWDRPIGAEYKCDGPPEATLRWLQENA